MNLFLIKIGKAWNVLKRDGLLGGTKRILGAFLSLFQRVEPGDILFISNGVGDSARYRTKHKAEELRLQGFKVSVTVQDNPFLVSYASKFSVFVFHRVLFTPRVATFGQEIKARKHEIMFDTDDLVYDPSFLPYMDGYQTMNPLERKLYEKGLGREILDDPAVTVCTASTTYLAHKLEERKKKVFVTRNTLSQEDVEWAEEIIEKKAQNSKLKTLPHVRIAYFSGTQSHNKDFAVITPVLAHLLMKYSHLRLVLAGPLDVTNILHDFESQIERVAFAPRKEHFSNIASADINLAPLEMGNPFCDSKSELKWFEAGLVSVPTVASATGTFREAITDGVDGFVASTPTEWTEKIERLIVSDELRKSMGEKARETVLKKYITKNADNYEYYEYLRLKVKKEF